MKEVPEPVDLAHGRALSAVDREAMGAESRAVVAGAKALAAVTCAREERGPRRQIADCDATLSRYYLSYASFSAVPLK